MVRPILKWAGGKRRIMQHLTPVFPERFENYHEPFCGGLSVYLELHKSLKKNVYVSDVSEPLINMYDVIKTQPERLIRELEKADYANTPDRFAVNRAKFNSVKNVPGIEQAALFLYLNKTCFNGMYRENTRGLFNVPYGSTTATFPDATGILECSKALAGVHLECCGYARAVSRVEPGDFVYMDPPYHDTFTGYTSAGFDESDQRALRDCVDDLTRRGALVVLSNSDTPFVRELYKAYTIHEIPVKRSITCKGGDRDKTFKELAIANF